MAGAGVSVGPEIMSGGTLVPSDGTGVFVGVTVSVLVGWGVALGVGVLVGNGVSAGVGVLGGLGVHVGTGVGVSANTRIACAISCPLGISATRAWARRPT